MSTISTVAVTAFGIAATAGAYALSLRARKHHPSPLTTPVLFGTTIVIAILLATGVSFQDYAPSIVLIQQIVPAVVALPITSATWVMPSALIWFALVLLGVLGVCGHFLLTWAYRRVQAGVLAPVDYLALPYAALLGFFFFGEVPTPALWAGAGPDRRGVCNRHGGAAVIPITD